MICGIKSVSVFDIPETSKGDCKMVHQCTSAPTETDD